MRSNHIKFVCIGSKTCNGRVNSTCSAYARPPDLNELPKEELHTYFFDSFLECSLDLNKVSLLAVRTILECAQ